MQQEEGQILYTTRAFITFDHRTTFIGYRCTCGYPKDCDCRHFYSGKPHVNICQWIDTSLQVNDNNKTCCLFEFKLTKTHKACDDKEKQAFDDYLHAIHAHLCDKKREGHSFVVSDVNMLFPQGFDCILSKTKSAAKSSHDHT